MDERLQEDMGMRVGQALRCKCSASASASGKMSGASA